MRFLLLALTRFLSRLRFPVLFALAAGLLLINLVLPDPLPWIDELVLLVGSAVLAGFKERRRGDQEDGDSTPGTPET